MERRKAITSAAAASLTLLAGATGIALNSGILRANVDDNIGKISPVDATLGVNPADTVPVDESPAAATVVSAAPSVRATASQPVTTSTASPSAVGDHEENEDDDWDEHEQESEVAEDREYEGADDDD